MKKYIDAEALANSLIIDPYECPGCPEPENLEEFLDWLDMAPAANVIELDKEYSSDEYEIVLWVDESEEEPERFSVHRKNMYGGLQ